MPDTTPTDPPSPSASLRERRAEILAEWSRLVRGLPPASWLSDEALLDHVPALLERIGEMADRLARGEAAPLPEREAAKHAHQRWRKGFGLHEVLREHALLRRAVAGTGHLGGGALRWVDQALDEAMILSAEKFAEMSTHGVGSIVSAVYDGILIANAEERVVMANEGAARIFGVPVEGLRIPLSEFAGRFHLRTPEGQPAAPIALAALAGEVVPWVERVIVDPASGAERHTRASAAPLRAPDGEIEGAIMVISDITDRVRSERLREEVLAIVSHDLRNPLGTIRTSTEVLLRTTDDARALRHLSAIERAAGRMDRLISDLLDMASIQAGRLSLDLRPTPAVALVDEAFAAHEPLALAKGIVLQRRPAPDGVTVRCDRERIFQVLANLLGNAIKFCKGGDGVTLGVEPGTHDAVFTVADTGPGIADEDIGRIFQPYWSASRHAKRGTGLGLHISRGIVEAHGGQIWAESRPGCGATFQFSLPLCA